MAQASSITETDILAEAMAADRGDLPAEVAESVLKWKLTDRAVSRINELAERNNQGKITDAERDELERYLRVGSLINLMQAKARLSLRCRGSSES